MADLNLPWEAVVRRYPGGQTVWIADATGREIVAWPGFDSSQCSKAERVKIARHIVQCVNAAASVKVDYSFRCYSCAKEWEGTAPTADCPACGTTNEHCAANPRGVDTSEKDKQ